MAGFTAHREVAAPAMPAFAHHPADAATALTSTAPLTAEIHHDIARVEGLWHALERHPAMSPHQTYDWCRAWVEAHSADVRIVILRSEGAVVGLLPMEVVHRGGARIARFIAAPFSNINFGLFAAADESALPFSRRSLRAALSAAAPDIDLFAFGRMPVSWRGQRNPLSRLESVESHNQAFQVTLEGGFQRVLERLNAKKRRKKFRASERVLEAHGGYEIVHAEDGEEAMALLETFFCQKQRRFAHQGKLDIFAREDVRSFFRRLASREVSSGVQPLRLSALRIGDGRIGAVTGLTIANRHVICQFCSLDEQAAQEFSVGEFLFHHLIRKACEDGQAIFDFGIGDERYKRSWCDVETVQRDYYLPLTLRGRVAARVLRLATLVKRRIKADPRLDRIARAIQRRVHRQ